MGCALQRPKKSKVRLLFYTDVHSTEERQAPKAMERAVESINNQGADLIINGGDLIHRGFQLSAAAAEKRWDIYMGMHQAIRGEIFSTLGNHDLVAIKPEDGSPPSEDPRAMFRKRLGLEGCYYSFDALGYHFVVLDSILIKAQQASYGGWIDPEQLEWLKEDLSKLPPCAPIVAVTHIPLLTNFHAATAGATQATPARLVISNNVEVLKSFAGHKLILVLQGHIHVDELIRWRGITFITGGAICGAWWRGPRLGTEEGYGMVTLDGDQMSWRYIDYGWDPRRRRTAVSTSAANRAPDTSRVVG